MFKNLVVFIPGIAGSVLRKDGKTLWGLTVGSVFRTFRGGSLDKLRVDLEDGRDNLGDGVTVDGLMPDVHLIPGLWKIDGYSGFISKLSGEMSLVEGKNLLSFAYDWRRDNRVNARKLAHVAIPMLQRWRTESGNSSAMLVVIAHSMGGLIARYFIECLEGWKFTDRLMSFGTPYRGSLDAVGYLANGFAKSIGPISIDATSTLRSLASVYQLLPTYEAIDHGNGNLVHVTDAAIPGLDHGMALDARKFHTEIMDAAQANSTLPDYVPVEVLPILSSTQPTYQSAVVNSAGVVLRQSRAVNGKDNDEGGDGTVPMVSAIVQDQKTLRGFYVRGIHGSLQTLDPVNEMVLGQLRASSVDLDELRRGAKSGGNIRFGLDDCYQAGRPIALQAEVRQATEQKLRASARNAETGETVKSTLWPGPDDRFETDMTLGEGIWRVTLSGDNSASVTDIILVAGSAN